MLASERNMQVVANGFSMKTGTSNILVVERH